MLHVQLALKSLVIFSKLLHNLNKRKRENWVFLVQQLIKHFANPCSWTLLRLLVHT